MDLLGQRLILNELHHFVLEDHLARRGGDVAADLECTFISQRNVAAAQVLQQVACTSSKALAATLERGLDRFRVGEWIVRGR